MKPFEAAVGVDVKMDERKALVSLGKILSIVILAIPWMGCNGVFFQPDRYTYIQPDPELIDFENLKIPSTDQITLDAWLISPRAPSLNTLVIHFHGNAQNRSAHIAFTGWLIDHGFHLLSFDYRGYGQSPGEPSRKGLVDDGASVFRYISSHPRLKNMKKVVIGQSLGGAISIVSAAESQARPDVMVIDSSFSSYRDIAIEKLQSTYVLWPLSWLPYILISDDLSPVDYIRKIPSSTRWLFVKSDLDPVVDSSHSLDLMSQLPKNRFEVWTPKPNGHTMAFIPESPLRPRLVYWLSQTLGLKNSLPLDQKKEGTASK